MESCLLSYYIHNSDVKSSCDFNLDELPDINSVYEVIRVLESSPLFLKEHIDRFYNSLSISELTCGISIQTLKKRIKVLIDLNGLKNGNIKWVYSVGSNNEQDLFLWSSPYLYPSEELFRTGVSCDTIAEKRINPNSKSPNSSIRERIKDKLENTGVYELILIDENEKLYEGSRSNLFFIKGNNIISACDRDVLEGVSRKAVIGICKEEGLELIKKDIYLREIENFDAAFLSGTSIKTLPINRIGAIEFNSNNKLFLKILEKFQAKMEMDVKSFKWNL